ncbi:hypothetical protein ACFSGX_14125 [Sphingomonas arantia]|uniref:Uncharacterized protein n=1 Tax=Sphingomonas arantia TaxID=1460676 RepID=A0ABW4U0T3_9SPHN
MLATAVSAGAQTYGPPAPAKSARTPVQALNSQYDERYGPRRNGRPCTVKRGEDIVVCADASGTSSPYRVPLPDDRFVQGERVSHPSEPASSVFATRFCHRPGCAEPSKLMETLGKLVSAVKGEEPK